MIPRGHPEIFTCRQAAEVIIVADQLAKKRGSGDDFQLDPMFPRIERAVTGILTNAKVVAPVDVLGRGEGAYPDARLPVSGGRPAMSKSWTCPACGRTFAQKNQRHACGTGDRRSVLRDRPEALVRLYASIEAFAKSLGPVEVVARDRYVLFRSVRIFADLVMMTDAVRIAIHLRRRVDDAIFFKIVSGPRAVTHVAKLRTDEEWTAVRAYVKEAYEASLS